MFTTKKKRIKRYLADIPDNNKTAFDLLLDDYLNGVLKSSIKALEINKVEIHIDWFEDIKCIGVQGNFKKYYMDLQIYPHEFSLSLDQIEPDDGMVHPLNSKEQMYNTLLRAIQALQPDT